MSQLDGIRSNLNQAQVISATYYPGIGIKKLTQANGLSVSYEYDGLNRLKTVKDHNGKVMDSYLYKNALNLISD